MGDAAFDVPVAYVNGKRYELPQGRAEVTLLTYLRGAVPLSGALWHLPWYSKLPRDTEERSVHAACVRSAAALGT